MKREEILSSCEDGSIYQVAHGMARNPDAMIHHNTLNLLDSLETMVINGYTKEALSLANHFACTDVLENYYKQLENLQSDAFIVPAIHESFADSQFGFPTFPLCYNFFKFFKSGHPSQSHYYSIQKSKNSAIMLL